MYICIYTKQKKLLLDIAQNRGPHVISTMSGTSARRRAPARNHTSSPVYIYTRREGWYMSIYIYRRCEERVAKKILIYIYISGTCAAGTLQAAAGTNTKHMPLLFFATDTCKPHRHDARFHFSLAYIAPLKSKSCH